MRGTGEGALPDVGEKRHSKHLRHPREETKKLRKESRGGVRIRTCSLDPEKLDGNGNRNERT